MKKSEQLKINDEVLSAILDIDLNKESVINKIQLNKCKAYIEETENYYLLFSYNSLFSYNTFVAFINKRERICYDILRLVHGYTSTSAQRIAKFRKAYGAVDTLTYRPVKVVSHD